MKPYIFTLLTLVLFSCSKDQPEKPNTPPKPFEVTTKAEGTDLILTWTEAVDEDAVTYAVVYGDTLAKGLTARTFTIKGLPYETEIAGTVVASDGKGGKTESGFKVKTLESKYFLILYPELEMQLISQGIDDVLDGRLLKSKALLVKELAIYTGMENLDILEEFLSLEDLLIEGAPLNNVSFKKLYNLKSVMIMNSVSHLDKIRFPDNPLLENLTVSLDETSTTNEVDINTNVNLKHIYIGGKSISKMSIINNQNLESVLLYNTKIKSIDFTNNTKLEYVDSYGNPIISFDFKSNSIKHLTISYLSDTFLINQESVSPDVLISKPSLLEELSLQGVAFSKIDLSKMTGLRVVNFRDVDFKGIDLSHLNSLNSLDFYRVKNFSLDLRPFKLLKNIAIVQSNLESIDLSQNTLLESVFLRNNRLKELNLCANSNIKYLDCSQNNISEIHISGSIQPTESWEKDPTATYKVCD